MRYQICMWVLRLYLFSPHAHVRRWRPISIFCVSQDSRVPLVRRIENIRVVGVRGYEGCVRVRGRVYTRGRSPVESPLIAHAHRVQYSVLGIIDGISRPQVRPRIDLALDYKTAYGSSIWI